MAMQVYDGSLVNEDMDYSADGSVIPGHFWLDFFARSIMTTAGEELTNFTDDSDTSWSVLNATWAQFDFLQVLLRWSAPRGLGSF